MEAGKTVEHSNDYAPDLLTPYFIITVEKKTLNYWSAPLLPFLSASPSHPLSDSVFYSGFYFSLLLFFNSLSLSEICKHNKTFLKWIPVVNKTINMQALLGNYLHKHHIRKHTQGVDTILWTPVQSNAIQRYSPAINTAFVRLLLYGNPKVGMGNKTTGICYNIIRIKTPWTTTSKL